MTIGEHLFYKDERNKRAAIATNLLVGNTCDKCYWYVMYHRVCRNGPEKKVSFRDTCWFFKENEHA